MKTHFYTFFFVCLSLFLNGQNTNNRTSIKGLGQGDASLLSIETFSSLENLSSLALTDSFSAGVSINNNFFLKELNTVSAGIIYSALHNSYGLHYIRFGTASYNENKIGLVYGKQLYKNIHIGARINYLLIDQNTYGKKSLFDFELGIRTKINSKINFATHIYNPLKLSVKSNNNELIHINSGVRAGLSIQEQKFTINLELESSTYQAFTIKTGFNWNIHQKLQLRAGVNFPNPKLSTGLSLSLNNTNLTFYYSYHIILQHNTGLGLNYEF